MPTIRMVNSHGLKIIVYFKFSIEFICDYEWYMKEFFVCPTWQLLPGGVCTPKRRVALCTYFTGKNNIISGYLVKLV